MHEWEVRLERAVQLGKSASHSRITENISPLRNRWHVQTVEKQKEKKKKKAERHHSQHICIQTQARMHAHTHTNAHTLAGLGEIFLPEEGGERKTGGGRGGRWRVASTETDLSRSSPQGHSVIGSSHRAVCVRVSACARAFCLKTNDVASP